MALIVHGSCMNDLQWKSQGHEHGASLARDLGYLPVYLHYNTGLHISQNGREFAGHSGLNHLLKIVFLGTPHHGAPLERAGNWIDRDMNHMGLLNQPEVYETIKQWLESA